MSTWNATTHLGGKPSRARVTPSATMSLVCETEEALEPREHDSMRFCADPTIRMALACSAPAHPTRSWHPWEG